MECIYTVENTFKAYYWDRLAGIAMVLKGGLEGDWVFFRNLLIFRKVLNTGGGWLSGVPC